MRKTGYILCFCKMLGVALLGLFVLSCEKGGDASGAEGGRYPVVVNADMAASGNTKVSAGAGNSLAWDSSDKLSFLAVTASGNSALSVLDFLAASSSDNSKAKFSGSVEMEQEPAMCYFVYPAVEGVMESDGQNAVATFSYASQTGKHEPFLYGGAEYSVSGMQVQLHHVGGMLRIKLPDASTVSRITVTGNDGEPLTPVLYEIADGGSGEDAVTGSAVVAEGAAGSFDVELSESSVEVKDGTCYCYIAMPPVHFPKGFSLIFSNGSKQMYRSFNYSVSGGCDFSQSADLHGAIVDIDASEFEGFEFAASVESEHVFENEKLVGTQVKLVGAAMQGYPASVVTEWGVELYNGSGEMVRSISYENLSGGTGYTKPSDISASNSPVMADSNGWPYLPHGEYTVKPYVKTIYSGEKQYGAASLSDVPVLDGSKLKPSVGAVTSYSYYLAGDLTNANKEGTGSSIYNITAGVNISDAILSSSKYAVNATVVDKSTSVEPSVAAELDASSQLVLAQYDVTEWKAYTIASYVEFDGVKSGQTTTTVHVTGLPYKAVPPKNSGAHPWSSVAGSNTFGDEYVELYYSASKYPEISSPVFHVPADIKVALSAKIVRNYYWASVSKGNIVIYQEDSGGNEVKLINQELARESTLEGTYTATMESDYTHQWFVRYDYMAAGPRTYVYYFNLNYQL